MLSATIPNYQEFARWVGNIKKTTIYIEITLKRIVPLQHQIYIDSQNIFEIKGTDGKIREDKVREAIKFLKNRNILHKHWNAVICVHIIPDCNSGDCYPG